MKLLVSLAATGLVMGAGIAVAQDEEPELELASKIIPVEAFLCNYNPGNQPRVIAREVGCQGCLAGTTFGIQDDNLVKIISIRCLDHRFAGTPSRFVSISRHELPQ